MNTQQPADPTETRPRPHLTETPDPTTTPTPTEPHHDTHSRRFELHRDTDVSGVSGTGVVADGVAFPDGVVALRWRSEWPTSVVFHDRGIEGVEAVHGHGGATRLVWLDAAAPAPHRDALEPLDLATTPTNEQQDARERAGRALYEHRQATNDFPPDGYTTWDDLPEEWQEEYREAADAVLAVVSAAAPDERELAQRYTTVLANLNREQARAVAAEAEVDRLRAALAARPAPAAEDDAVEKAAQAVWERRSRARQIEGRGELKPWHIAVVQAAAWPSSPVAGEVAACRQDARAALTAALAARPAPTVSGADAERAAATLAERIDGGAWADYFAAAIAPPEVLGEHSSANNPWLNALNYAETRPAPVVSGEAVERAARALYVRTARDNATHDEAVAPWSSLRSDIRSRWLDYASDALTAALGITVADAPAAEPKSPWEHPGHAPVQHRDRKAPWCDECGWSSPAGPFPAALLGEPRSTVADEGRAEA